MINIIIIITIIIKLGRDPSGLDDQQSILLAWFSKLSSRMQTLFSMHEGLSQPKLVEGVLPWKIN